LKNIFFLLGPTLIIFIGLTQFESVPITFVLFYSWLFIIPLITSFKSTDLKKTLGLSFKNGFSSNVVIYGIVSGVFGLSAIFALVSLLQNYLFNIGQLKELLVSWNFSGSNVWGLILILLVINPFLEELYWREFMHGRLLPLLGDRKTIFVTSFFYSLYHLLSLIPMLEMPFSLIAAIPVFLAGLLWGYFRIKFKTMVAPVISHVLADLGIVFVYLYYFI